MCLQQPRTGISHVSRYRNGGSPDGGVELGLGLDVVMVPVLGPGECFRVWPSASSVVRAEWPGAGAAVAETGSGGGPRPLSARPAVGEPP